MEQGRQFAQHRAQAAGGVEVLHIVFAGGLQVDQDRRRVAEFVQAVESDPDPGAPGDRGQVDDAVGRAADRQQHAQGVFHRRFADHPRRREARADHGHGARTAGLGRA
jgi:hypothetical protein